MTQQMECEGTESTDRKGRIEAGSENGGTRPSLDVHRARQRSQPGATAAAQNAISPDAVTFGRSGRHLPNPHRPIVGAAGPHGLAGVKRRCSVPRDAVDRPRVARYRMDEPTCVAVVRVDTAVT